MCASLCVFLIAAAATVDDATMALLLLLWRRRTLPSADGVAVVLMEAASDPAVGSVRAKAATCSPVASLGRYAAFCASVPTSRIPYSIGQRGRADGQSTTASRGCKRVQKSS